MANVQITSNEWKYDTEEKSGPSATFWTRLSQISAESRRSRFALLREIIALRLGSGHLSFDEYVGLKLYDKNFYRNADPTTFVGFETLQKIWIQVNYRFDFFGLVNNKIATDILFGTYGFPIMPTVAIFRDQIGRASPFLLRSEEELRNFLTKKEYYPLFGKPINGHQSHGSASLDHYDAVNNRIITTTRFGIPIDTFVSYIKEYSAAGYLFQRRVNPHSVVQKICGQRLATVRLLTIMTKGKPKILRACWKIPAGNNIADNFWRPGNLLAQLDLDTGRVLSAVQSTKRGFKEITHHPDTRTEIVGITVPNWSEIVSLVTDGANVLQEMGLMGWDIAPIESGAVIVEINETPDFKLHQLADRRGMMDADFKAFLAERKNHAADWLQGAKQKKKIVTELVPPPTQTKDGKES